LLLQHFKACNNLCISHPPKPPNTTQTHPNTPSHHTQAIILKGNKQAIILGDLSKDFSEGLEVKWREWEVRVDWWVMVCVAGVWSW
jgi:hypothetical protein